MEFAKTYIQIVEELKINIQEVQNEFAVEKQNLDTYQRFSFENKNEKLNVEGINEQKARFYITINHLEFTNPNDMRPGVCVALKYLNQNNKTRKQNSGYVWDEKFEL